MTRVGSLRAAMAVAGLCLAPLAAAAETLNVTLGKADILRIGRPASAIMVGKPDVADVTVESPRLIFVIGKKVGETNLVILDGEGNQIVSYDVVVVPEADRHVTVYRSTDGVATLSCDPRCVGVDNPGLEGAAKPGAAAPAAGAPASGAAPGAAAAGQAAPAAPSAPAATGGSPVDEDKRARY